MTTAIPFDETKTTSDDAPVPNGKTTCRSDPIPRRCNVEETSRSRYHPVRPTCAIPA